jgi:hypothetical protein
VGAAVERPIAHDVVNLGLLAIGRYDGLLHFF